MPYKYLHVGNRYGLKNKKTGKIIWYNPKKVSSMEDLKRMARIREAYSHGWKPRGLANANKSTRKRVASKGGRSRRKYGR